LAGHLGEALLADESSKDVVLATNSSNNPQNVVR